MTRENRLSITIPVTTPSPMRQRTVSAADQRTTAAAQKHQEEPEER